MKLNRKIFSAAIAASMTASLLSCINITDDLSFAGTYSTYAAAADDTDTEDIYKSVTMDPKLPLGFELDSPGLALTSASGKPGETVRLYLLASANDELESFQGNIKFDPVLKIVPYAVNELSKAFDIKSGTCKILIYDGKEIPDGAIACIDFTIPKNARRGKTYDVPFESVDVFGIFNGPEISKKVQVYGGTVTVSSGTASEKADADNVDYDLVIKNDSYHVNITGGDTNASFISLPTEVNGIPVKSIAESAFSGNKTLKNVNIPASVVEIGPYAFEDCVELRNVSIPYGVESIHEGTFENCQKLSNLYLSETVSEIGKKAFKGCESLSDVRLPMSVERIDKHAFMNCTSLSTITFMNPKCVIDEQVLGDEAAVSEFKGVIRGEENSTAHLFAKKYGLRFEVLNDSDHIAPKAMGPVGDANGDGNINVRDAAYIAKYLAQGKSNMLTSEADFNCDGQINVRDAAAIAKYLASR